VLFALPLLIVYEGLAALLAESAVLAMMISQWGLLTIRLAVLRGVA
jgi:hypothetical protein